MTVSIFACLPRARMDCDAKRGWSVRGLAGLGVCSLALRRAWAVSVVMLAGRVLGLNRFDVLGLDRGGDPQTVGGIRFGQQATARI